MSPTFRRGSLLIIKQIDTDSIKVGDIITYRKAGDSLATTHRVTEIIEEDGAKKFVTKGDANNINDPVPVDQEYVIGKVAFFIPYIGFVMAFVRTKQGTLLVIVIPALNPDDNPNYRTYEVQKKNTGRKFKKKILSLSHSAPVCIRRFLMKKAISIMLLVLSAAIMVSGLTIAYFYDKSDDIQIPFTTGILKMEMMQFPEDIKTGSRVKLKNLNGHSKIQAPGRHT